MKHMVSSFLVDSSDDIHPYNGKLVLEVESSRLDGSTKVQVTTWFIEKEKRLVIKVDRHVDQCWRKLTRAEQQNMFDQIKEVYLIRWPDLDIQEVTLRTPKKSHQPIGHTSGRPIVIRYHDGSTVTLPPEKEFELPYTDKEIDEFFS